MKTDWKQIIGTVAPALATALGGPLVGMATSAISQVVLGTPDGNEDDIAAAVLKGGPEMLARLKEADSEFKLRMKELEIDLERINAGDRASAREMAKATKSSFPAVLAFLILLAALGAAISILVGWSKVESVMAGTVLGYLFSESKQVTTFFFGSSSGSSRKNDMLEGMLKK